MKQANCHDDCVGTRSWLLVCNVVSPNGQNASVAVAEKEPGRVISISPLHQCTFSLKYGLNVILICTYLYSITVNFIQIYCHFNTQHIAPTRTSVLIQWHMGNVSIRLTKHTPNGARMTWGFWFFETFRWLGICPLLAICNGTIVTQRTNVFHTLFIFEPEIVNFYQSVC